MFARREEQLARLTALVRGDENTEEPSVSPPPSSPSPSSTARRVKEAKEYADLDGEEKEQMDAKWDAMDAELERMRNGTHKWRLEYCRVVML
jgi:hypothetical protein